MKPDELEDLLWELAAESESAPEGPADVDDQRLLAYRRGELPPAAVTEIEAALAHSPSLRARAVALAGVETRGLDDALRRRVLDRALGDGAQELVRHEESRRWLAWAAVAVLSLGLGFFVWLDRPSSVIEPGKSEAGTSETELAEFEITLEALASRRSLDESRTGEAPRAYPETPLRLFVESRGEARADLEFALYGLRENRLQRLRGGSFEPIVERGAAFFEVPAADLVGSEIGVHDFWVIVASRGNLPPDRVIRPGETVEAVADDLGDSVRRVYRRRLELLPPAL